MNLLIVDDEPLARSRLKRLAEQVAGCMVLGEAGNGREAVELVERLAPDVVLMDIQMPLMDGLEAARHIAELETPPAVIFCTAYDEYALDAFNVQAVGYLLKPVRAEQLAAALQKLHKVNRVQARQLQQGERRSHISARTHQGLVLLPVEQVRFFQSDQKYVSVIHPGGELLIEDSLKELEEEFSTTFIRVHRNALVALRYVLALEKDTDGSQWLVLEGVQPRVQISRRHLADVRKVLKHL
jgi:two-component system, LytTR family, response regulator AlgR